MNALQTRNPLQQTFDANGGTIFPNYPSQPLTKPGQGAPWNPWQPGNTTYHRNFPNAEVYQFWGNGTKVGQQNGYGIDLDQDGKYTKGKDGIIAFDKNKDGNIDFGEIEESKNILKVMGGDFDLNGDGKLGFSEMMNSFKYMMQGFKMDKNHDGRLSQNELKAANAKVFIDKNKDGQVDKGELRDPGNLNGTRNLYGSSKDSISYIDPWSNRTAIKHEHPWLMREGSQN